jgi:uncharacterized YccA/Bax inhibitor family protein
MNKTLYIIFMALLVLAFAGGMYLSLEAGETLGKSIVRALPIFLVMLVFYKLRKIDIDRKQKELTKNTTESNKEQADHSE